MHKKLCLCALLMSITWQVKTMYIIYKTKNMRTVEAPTQQEFNKAYEILMTYQFPMSMDDGHNEINIINYMLQSKQLGMINDVLIYLRALDAIPSNISNETELEKYMGVEKNLKEVQDVLLQRIEKLKKESNFAKFMALTSDDQKQLIQQEQAFLTEKIKKIDSSLSLSFIPTTVYELLFFKFYITGLQQLTRQTRFTFILENNTFIDLQELFVMGQLAPSSARNTSTLMCTFQHDINTRIIHFFDDSYNKIQCKPDDIQNMLPSLLKSLTTISKVYENMDFNIVEDFSSIEKMKDILSKAIEAEFEANSKHCCPLYRGTTGFEGTLDKIIGAGGGRSGPYKGLSYGNSLFAGIFIDTNASAFSFINKSALGYVLLIPKDTYLNVSKNIHKTSFSKEDKTSGIAYYIPPLNTLCGILSGGETFHARLTAFNKDTATEQNFQKLISTNARIIKNTSTFTDKQLTEVQTVKEPLNILAEALFKFY